MALSPAHRGVDDDPVDLGRLGGSIRVSVTQWVIAFLWLAGIMTMVMLVLLLVALADPARRAGSRDQSGGRRHDGPG